MSPDVAQTAPDMAKACRKPLGGSIVEMLGLTAQGGTHHDDGAHGGA